METINWMQEEPEHTGEGDYVDAFVQKLELDESAIMEVSLCDNSKFVPFITKKFQIENYIPIPMTFHMLFRRSIMNILYPERKSTWIEDLSRDG